MTKWFEYKVCAYPHHSDYSGVVWHGVYISWMEEARVAYLDSLGIAYADMVKSGYELPVVELSFRYHQGVTMGETVVIKTCVSEIKGVRIHWDYRLESLGGKDLYATGKVTLVTIDSTKGKIMRQMPPFLKSALLKCASAD